MCLAMPAQITKILDNHKAIASIGGIKKEISTVFVDSLSEGDYVILHVGYALTRMDEAQAQKTLALYAEMMSTEEEG